MAEQIYWQVVHDEEEWYSWSGDDDEMPDSFPCMCGLIYGNETVIFYLDDATKLLQAGVSLLQDEY